MPNPNSADIDPDYEDGPADQPEAEMSDNGPATALLPKTFFGSKDKDIGDTCKIKIEKIFEDEIQVSYVKHKDKDDDDDDDSDKEPEDPEMASAMEDY